MKKKVPLPVAMRLLTPILGGVMARRIKAISRLEMYGYLIVIATLTYGGAQSLTKGGHLFLLYAIEFGYLMLACSHLYGATDKDPRLWLIFVAATLCVGMFVTGVAAWIERGANTIGLYAPLTCGMALQFLGRIRHTER